MIFGMLGKYKIYIGANYLSDILTANLHLTNF